MIEVGLIHSHRKPRGITMADTATQDKEKLKKQNFIATAPLNKLSTDITEVQCADGDSMFSQFTIALTVKLLFVKMHKSDEVFFVLNLLKCH